IQPSAVGNEARRATIKAYPASHHNPPRPYGTDGLFVRLMRIRCLSRLPYRWGGTTARSPLHKLSNLPWSPIAFQVHGLFGAMPIGIVVHHFVHGFPAAKVHLYLGGV